MLIGNLGWTEMFFIVAFALIIFGPRKIPEIAKVIGRTMAQLRRASEEFKRTWEAEVERDQLKDNQQLAATNSISTSNDDDEDDEDDEMSQQAIASVSSATSVTTHPNSALVIDNQPSLTTHSEKIDSKDQNLTEDKEPAPIA
ncbi:MAG: twin-arginine translocase TatA/TatE family subunit [Acidobacteriota bacterium]